MISLMTTSASAQAGSRSIRSKAAQNFFHNLSDSKKNKMKFQFPQGTKLKADGYLTVFCTGDNKVDPGASCFTA